MFDTDLVQVYRIEMLFLDPDTNHGVFEILQTLNHQPCICKWDILWDTFFSHIIRLTIFNRVRNLKFATCGNTNKINELRWDLLNV